MEPAVLKTALLGFTRGTYPEMQVNIEPWSQDPNRLAITFVEPAFANLYPAQRYHQLVHLIPDPFFVEHLANTVWFEMAPGETSLSRRGVRSINIGRRTHRPEPFGGI